MAKKTISARINVSKINKDWMYQGEKGKYLDVILYVNDEEDEYGNNGLVVQSIPKIVREDEKHLPLNEKTQSEILGNCKVFAARNESSPNTPLQPMENDDDLPF